MGIVVAVSLSEKKGEKKRNVEFVNVLEDYGIEGDAHAGGWHRQISLLALESIKKMREKGLDVNPGDFAENVTTEGIDFSEIKIGTKLKVGEVLLEITQKGKVCHERCAIYYQAGDCIMPKEGVFAKVLKGGKIYPGDSIEVIEND
ncbi:MOSC domain-containing protein [Thermovenabulum gondwanense]|uniref:MOSC domain-containing protein n=1 Tax=Thermovenabulum gondwanense TaxID=520767 RepID=A0A161PWI0_9FIRM|nr:MOSC domain-containing protein [Thermovenabulum gondwanense]KYO68000.1 hypothetical protein ATZ99_03100 [Thermovenabulum gondwanense]